MWRPWPVRIKLLQNLSLPPEKSHMRTKTFVSWVYEKIASQVNNIYRKMRCVMNRIHKHECTGIVSHLCKFFYIIQRTNRIRCQSTRYKLCFFIDKLLCHLIIESTFLVFYLNVLDNYPKILQCLPGVYVSTMIEPRYNYLIPLLHPPWKCPHHGICECRHVWT